MRAMMVAVLAAGMLAGAFAQPDPRTMPRLVNLSDAHLSGLTAEERLIVQMRWFAAEIAMPSDPTRGIGGGMIDTEYRQAQFIKGLGFEDPRPLRWLLESKKLKLPSLDSALSISLALAGDASKITKVRKLLRSDPDRERRALAAAALGSMNAEEAKPDLKAALLDPYRYPPIVGGLHPTTEADYYPVRKCAEVALRVIGTPETAKWAEKERTKFLLAMSSYDSYVKENAAFLKTLLDTANRVGVKA